MIDDFACRWAARIDRGLDAPESAALETWLAEDGRHRGALLRALAGLSLLDRGRALGGLDDAPTEGIDRRRLLAAGTIGAAAAAVAGGVGIRLLTRGTSITTAVGEIRHMPLGDGSVAVVNSHTRLRVRFSEDRRDVELAEGEAWFQVAKNRARPFTVAAGPVRVQAVGTAFDVRRHGGASEVVVTEGKVKVWSVDSDAKPIFVSAGHRALVSDHVGVELAAVPPAAADQQLAWRQGLIVLDNMTLAAAAAEFNRYHDVRLEVAPALAGRRVVGWFRTDDLEGFATASAAMVGGRVERAPGVIRIAE
jgi:transmembrane sensor